MFKCTIQIRVFSYLDLYHLEEESFYLKILCKWPNNDNVHPNRHSCSGAVGWHWKCICFYWQAQRLVVQACVRTIHICSLDLQNRTVRACNFTNLKCTCIFPQLCAHRLLVLTLHRLLCIWPVVLGNDFLPSVFLSGWQLAELDMLSG